MSTLRFLGCLLGLLTACSFSSGFSHGETSPALPQIHPRVFELITGWFSDQDLPVVTEINLDAVATNRNQFDSAKVTKDGDWTSCPTEDGRGFQRYRQVSAEAGRWTVNYQYNGGGTLTASTRIEFTLEQRAITKDGKPTKVKVLRVLAVSQ